MKKVLSTILSIVLFVSILAGTASEATVLAASGSGIGQKTEVTRSIAIVFDNSGSMYEDPSPTSWCSATYAMEVFASMANEGDTIAIYPMNPIVIGYDGTTQYDYYNPLTIQGGGDTSVIQQIYTMGANPEDTSEIWYSGTPAESIEAAADGLSRMSGDEKWLIVVTDGTEFHKEDGSSASGSELEKLLGGYFNQAMSSGENVMFLGIGSNSVQPNVTNNSKTYHIEIAQNSDQIIEKLTTMCNLVYGRSALSGSHISGNDVNFDLSMSRLILFVQGDDITDLKLTDASGQEVGAQQTAYSPHYSTLANNIGVLNYYWDESLTGMIVSYEDVEAGSYSLSYSGNAKSVQVYYEPKVQLIAQLTDEEGNLVTDYDRMIPGTYKLQYGLFDENGQETTSDLLGDRNFEIHLSVNGTEQVSTGTQNGSTDIVLNEGDVIEGYIHATYLDGYECETNSADHWGWPESGIRIAKNDFDVDLSAPQNYYVKKDIESGQPLIVKLAVGGESMTADQLEQVQMSVQFGDTVLTEGTDYTLNRNAANSTIEIQMKNTSKMTTGKHKVTVTCTGVNSAGQSIGPSEDHTKIRIELYPRWLRILVTLLIIGAIALILTIILNTKVLPKKVLKGSCTYTVKGKEIAGDPVIEYTGKNAKSGSLNIDSPRCPFNPGARCGVNLELEAVSPRRIRSAERQMKVVGVSANHSNNVQSIKIGAVTFVKNKSGQFVKAGVKPGQESVIDIDISSGAIITVTGVRVENTQKLSLFLKVKLQYK